MRVIKAKDEVIMSLQDRIKKLDKIARESKETSSMQIQRLKINKLNKARIYCTYLKFKR